MSARPEGREYHAILTLRWSTGNTGWTELTDAATVQVGESATRVEVFNKLRGSLQGRTRKSHPTVDVDNFTVVFFSCEPNRLEA